MSSALQREFPLEEADFRRIARLVKERAGIVLGERKLDLVYGRLVRRLRALRLDSFAAYCALLEGPHGEGEVTPMVNAITTNLTSFFREPHHFDHLARTVLQPLVRQPHKGRRIRIWSAGCSSGEEPYSVAMMLRSTIPVIAGWDARILATDIDTEMIERATSGRYDARGAVAMPAAFRAKFVEDGAPGEIRIADEIRRLVSFKPLNLLGHWPMRGPFDAIFCRNVVIYFDKAQQSRLFDRIADLLADDGWLYIGHSESLLGVTDRFVAAGRTTYRKIS
jgi:chemotaxis protein methyltransferase CheR